MMFFIHEIPKGIYTVFSQIITPKFIKRTEHSEEQLKKPNRITQTHPVLCWVGPGLMPKLFCHSAPELDREEKIK